ncbi:hypothetical protein TrVFT333_009945 [Trichoderma virens FT-333]|nr:hypothetical protein TrVFT333_009945 [Trichoderma virens FT-333]
MTKSRDTLQRKNVEFAEALRDKNRKLSQTQELYNKVKRKAELGQIERAAFDAVDSSVRLAPQPAMNSQEPHAFLPSHLRDTNERSYPLGHGLGLDATGFTTSRSGSSLQQNEREGPWLRKPTPPHGLAPVFQSYRRTASDQGRADNFHPNIASNTGLPRADSMRQSSVNSPGISQRSNPWAGVGLTSGLKVGQPSGLTGANGPLGSL